MEGMGIWRDKYLKCAARFVVGGVRVKKGWRERWSDECGMCLKS
jgi:hypothetical protein